MMYNPQNRTVPNPLAGSLSATGAYQLDLSRRLKFFMLSCETVIAKQSFAFELMDSLQQWS